MTKHKAPVAMKKGGCATKKYAKGGSVKKHDDAAMDKKLIKAEIKKAAVKPVKLAAGGAAKQRRGFEKTIAPKKK